ncbi:N-acetyltransferase-like protein 9 [Rhexocercosporidium sp. MPI-PUGE-AT-0058]|nr:N-acetyltransferase-like protein 9 [Rhexocercosporidium sp. MPI-PUGE-AT-0058]
MLINKGTAISTSSILLVPYEASHVPTYHEWMKDEKIQAETASEPLTLEEEYAMQRSWRTDVDKLTFIAYSPPSMLGDVNLFLTPSPTPPSSPTSSSTPSHITHHLTGELELMIAPLPSRRRGHGRAAILAFLTYISAHLPAILAEYARGQTPPLHSKGEGEEGEEEGDRVRLEGLRVKIGKGNIGSLALFRSLGFASREGGEEPNYFGEVELWFDGEVGGMGMW